MMSMSSFWVQTSLSLTDISLSDSMSWLDNDGCVVWPQSPVITLNNLWLKNSQSLKMTQIGWFLDLIASLNENLYQWLFGSCVNNSSLTVVRRSFKWLLIQTDDITLNQSGNWMVRERTLKMVLIINLILCLMMAQCDHSFRVPVWDGNVQLPSQVGSFQSQIRHQWCDESPSNHSFDQSQRGFLIDNTTINAFASVVGIDWA